MNQTFLSFDYSIPSEKYKHLPILCDPPSPDFPLYWKLYSTCTRLRTQLVYKQVNSYTQITTTSDTDVRTIIGTDILPILFYVEW